MARLNPRGKPDRGDLRIDTPGVVEIFTGNGWVTVAKEDESRGEKMTLLRPSKSERLKFNFQRYAARMVKTMLAKNADYAGASDDPFGNFSAVEKLGIASTETGMLTRMTDKLCRVSTFVQKGVLSVKEESVEDTLIDLANYAVLLACYIKQKKEAAHGQCPTEEACGEPESPVQGGPRDGECRDQRSPLRDSGSSDPDCIEATRAASGLSAPARAPRDAVAAARAEAERDRHRRIYGAEL